MVALLRLEPGWNSYSARVTTPESAIRAISVLVEFLELGVPPPNVVPMVSGGIQLEWHTGGVDVEVYAETDVTFFAGKADAAALGGCRAFEGPLVGQEYALRAWLKETVPS